ncbi:MAG: nucleotidyltransferase domain-containing protein [Prevotellaceae bacterium]|jgi:predicted nucleotidyltransferase|nr:nucleotidyltransferase domain-containing protein [Prevotellaceae bacterium]
MLIREKDKEALQQIFSSAGQPFEVWAYGSRVDGSAHSGSDLDLVIRTGDLKPLPHDVFMALTEKIQDSTIPILVELRDWASLPENFRKNIAQQYEVLYREVLYSSL